MLKYHHGMKDPKEMQNDALCLSETTEKQIYQILYFLSYGELMDIGTVIGDLEGLVKDTVLHCAVYETLQEVIVDKCFSPKMGTDESECSITKLFSNLYTHWLLLISIVESLASIIVTQTFWAKEPTPKELHDLAFEIGEDLGELVVTLFDL